MFYFLKGNITHINKDSIVIEVKDIGYEVIVSKPDKYVVGNSYLIYTHLVVREDEQYLIGFDSIKEKEAFLFLLSVKGIGPKIALNALSATTPDYLEKAIASNNIAFLKQLPGIGSKAAAQIILDLKGKITGIKGNPNQYEDVKDALRQLGFKTAIIDRVLAQIYEPNATNDEILAIALKKMRNK